MNAQAGCWTSVGIMATARRWSALTRPFVSGWNCSNRLPGQEAELPRASGPASSPAGPVWRLLRRPIGPATHHRRAGARPRDESGGPASQPNRQAVCPVGLMIGPVGELTCSGWRLEANSRNAIDSWHTWRSRRVPRRRCAVMDVRFNRPFCILPVLTLAGCVRAASVVEWPYQAASQDEIEVRLPVVESVRLEEPGHALLVRPVDLVVVPDGYAIVDMRGPDVKRYDRRGHLLDVLGRQGSGPGEFQAPVAAAYLEPKGHLAVLDAALKRVTVFDDAGRVVSTFETAPLAFPVGMAAEGTRVWVLGRVYAAQTAWKDVVVGYQESGLQQSQRFVLSGSRALPGFVARSAWSSLALSDAGEFVVASEFSDSLLIISATGRTSLPVGAPVFSAMPRRFGAYVRWRRSWPVVERAFASQGRVLLRYGTWPDAGRDRRRFVEVVTPLGKAREPLVESRLLLAVSGNLAYFVDDEAIPRVLEIRAIKASAQLLTSGW